MASQDHQEVQQELKAVHEKVSEMETSLAAAEKAKDMDKVKFLRARLVQLDRECVLLREKENKLMLAQLGGQHCFYLAETIRKGGFARESMQPLNLVCGLRVVTDVWTNQA